jgi:hypothetical protein
MPGCTPKYSDPALIAEEHAVCMFRPVSTDVSGITEVGMLAPLAKTCCQG